MLTTYRSQQEHFPNIYARRLREAVHALAESVENHTQLSKQVTQPKHLSSYATATNLREGKTAQALNKSPVFGKTRLKKSTERTKDSISVTLGCFKTTGMRPLRNARALMKAGGQPSW